MGDLESDIARLDKLSTYNGRKICPQCTSGFPVCSEFKVLPRPAMHRLACRRYHWGQLCDDCVGEK